MWTDLPLFPEQASTVAARIDALTIFLVAVSLFFSLLICVLVIGFAVKYRRRSESERPRPIHGDLRLELLWSGIPLCISMAIFTWGASLYFEISKPPPGPWDLYVVAKQWMWKIQHLEGPREINELHVPTGRPIKLIMTSEDVIHSFFVPAFRVKMDVLPGRYTEMWFEATRPGVYHLFCAEYCGTKHSSMIGKVVVMEPVKYQEWLGGGARGLSMAAAGEQLFLKFGCNTCHSPASGAKGPALEGLFGKEVRLTGGGTVVADERYIRESIIDPNVRIVEGYQPNLMPTVYRFQLNEEELLQLLAYLKNLGAKEGGGG